ncbi:hypothetical protein V6N12_029762 [Hibiscus sabdariffa]|uniref:Uncharacterized protein n=1 Tax=Hibiscus sabdariffa TaxID=183260 RepID=A0ABR2CXE6_9ROSI
MEEHVQKSLKWLEDRSKGNTSHELEPLAFNGLQILHAQKGSIRCSFVVPSRASVNTTQILALASSVLTKAQANKMTV